MKKSRSVAILIALFFAVSSFNAQDSGDISKLRGTSRINIIYDYSNMSVGSYDNEQDYINKKMDDYSKKDPEKAEKFKESWYNSRRDRFEPKFLELFNKNMEKAGIEGVNYSKDAPVTLVVKTVKTEPGYNIGISRMPAYIDADCIFLDQSGKEFARYLLKNVAGANAMGFDYDTGSRLSESYAKSGKILAKKLTKDLK